ncbi:methyltransferase family protein [Trichloromonas sp.]|uniref:methyltransferase family protein n=1 Tax=Trichloromonas sp. TaxID=3069249 RepID=UPI003D816E6C
MEPFSLARSLLFLVFSLVFLRISWKPLHNPKCHGFYRFFAFENTVNLVTGGIYRYIRHPMYSSLMLLAWGAFLKHFSPAGLVAVVLTSALLVVAGYIEERENLAFFGPAYLEYRKTTKMFLPFLF